MASYGEVGVNVGSVGRWVRFAFGVSLLALVVKDFYSADHGHDVAFYIIIVLSFAAITGFYTAAHVMIGDKLRGRSSWWGTFIFVVPAMFLLIAPGINQNLQIGHWIGVPDINHPFRLALLLYIGISFFFQWHAKYGGCEVVSIPNFLFKKDYGSYCVPFLPLDMAEKFIVDKLNRSETKSESS